MRRPTACAIIALLASAACACAPDGTRTESEGGGTPLATYAGGTFTSEDFRRVAERMPARSVKALADPAVRRELVESHVVNALLAREGRARGYDRDPDLARQVAELEERLIVQRVMKDLQEPDPIDDDELRRVFDANARLYSGGQVRARHLLVKDAALAEKLRAEILADPDRFAALAEAHSQDNVSKRQGGDLGFFGQGRMVPAFERAAFALAEPGDVSDVVETPFGYHVIMLTDVRPGPVTRFEDVKDRIRVALMGERRQAVLAERIEAMKTAANLVIDDAALAAVPIPSPNPAYQRKIGH